MNHTKHSSGSYSSFKVFDRSLQLVDAVAPLLASVRKHDRSLMDQLRRATQSGALNVAEGAGNNGANRRDEYLVRRNYRRRRRRSRRRRPRRHCSVTKWSKGPRTTRAEGTR